MQAWFASGAVLEAIIGLMALEALALVWLRRRGLLLNVLSGVAMLLAWRVSQGGAWWGWISACLLLAGGLHALDVWRRWAAKPESAAAK